MAYQIIWSNFAAHQLDKIFNYFAEEVNQKVAKHIIAKIYIGTNNLTKTPFIGQLEPLLTERKENYRYLIIGNYKVIYTVNEAQQLVKIADVFDCRQNPTKLKRN